MPQKDQKNPAKNPQTQAEMGFLDHLAELRRRLIISAIAVICGAILAYCFSDTTFRFLSAPYYQSFQGNLLIGTGPAEAFLLKLKVAFFIGLILASPVVFYQLWLFVEPGLYPQEKRLAAPFVVSTTFLFSIGVLFCYYLVFPMAFSFFHSEYRSIGITPTIRLSEFLTLLISMLLAFGVVFEMPVLAYFLGRLGIINADMLVKGARYAVVIIFIISAVLTPPDVISQLLMAVPLLLLYGLSIIIVRYSAKTSSVSATQQSESLPQTESQL